MHRHYAISAFVSALCFCSGVVAEEKPLSDRVAESIQNLSHDRFGVRDAATRNLLTIGEPALTALKAATASKDAEVRRRIETVVRAIEANVQNDALLQAPKLRLRYQNSSLDEVVADLAQKTGIPYMLDPKVNKNGRKPITLDTGDVPFWEAIEKVLAGAGLVETYTQPAQANAIQQPQVWSGRAVRYGRGGRAQQPAQKIQIHLIDCDIPLASAANTLIRVKVLPKDAPGSVLTKGSNEIQFVLDVTPAPSLTWLGTVNVDIRKAIDDRGASLTQSHLRGSPNMIAENGYANTIQNGIVFQGGGQLIVNGDITWGEYPQAAVTGNWRHLPISLLGAQSPSKSLRQLEGVVTAQVLTPAQTLLAIENIITASAKTTVENGEHRLEVLEHSVDKNGSIKVKFRVVSPASGQEMLFQQLAIGNGLQFDSVSPGPTPPVIAFQDASGKKLNVSLSLIEQNFNGENQTSDYQAVVPARGQSVIKLVMTGRKSAMVKVPFALKDVPLP